MKKWYFSNNGEISGPLDLTSARKIVEKNADLYGWHPSFSTWKPVRVIGEFSELIKTNLVTNQVPKEIINEFNNTKIALSEKLSLVAESIKETEMLKAKLKKKISLYKHLTEDLSDDFKSAIISIEQQYSSFNKRLLNLQDAANIAKNEIEEVTQKFKEQLYNKQDNIDVPSDLSGNVRKISTSVENMQQSSSDFVDDVETVIDIDADFDLVDESVHLIEDEATEKSVSDKYNTKIQIVDDKVTEAKPVKAATDEEVPKKIKKISTVADNSTINATAAKVSNAEVVEKPEAPIKRMVIGTKAPEIIRQPIKISTQENPNEDKDTSQESVKAKIDDVNSANENSNLQNTDASINQIKNLENTEEQTKKGLAGVKGMFKSVFKSQVPAPKLSAQLKMSEAIKETDKQEAKLSANDESGAVVELKKAVNESEVTNADEDDTKKVRRRRRRR
ncbi:DUF4339 domain-containing protein [Thalassotalea profundi]|uniref:GYF domain-containing protein n=1 Tax=Thalassotalea profundi TaxID=2036687 RepID=A0ABQ3II77_9GAMM|nr:DUF4339 domain-containing protein [Thalassotalea profundi]GHE79076.1 hypothetical protein GCM10011501_03760 [Thalassotalea profundi]